MWCICEKTAKYLFTSPQIWKLIYYNDFFLVQAWATFFAINYYNERTKNFFGILDAVEMGTTKLKCLNPFNDIYSLCGDSISFDDDIQFPKEGNLDVNERCKSDSDDEYVLDDERYAFDAIAVYIEFNSCKLS